VVEQADTNKFRRANLLNEGAKYATGDILVLHDIDYYPEHVTYWDGVSDVYLPVKYVRFVYNDLNVKPIDEVPGGYRHFVNGVDENFFGGVTTFKRDAFFKINGFSWRYVGWGFEDADLRERIAVNNLTVARSQDNVFLALDHPDSGPQPTDRDFLKNIQMSMKPELYFADGVNNQPSSTDVGLTRHPGVDLWLLASDFDGPTNIITSSFDWLTDD
jgi:hypothetical protein